MVIRRSIFYETVTEPAMSLELDQRANRLVWTSEVNRSCKAVNSCYRANLWAPAKGRMVHQVVWCDQQKLQKQCAVLSVCRKKVTEAVIFYFVRLSTSLYDRLTRSRNRGTIGLACNHALTWYQFYSFQQAGRVRGWRFWIQWKTNSKSTEKRDSPLRTPNDHPCYFALHYSSEWVHVHSSKKRSGRKPVLCRARGIATYSLGRAFGSHF